MYIIYIVIMQLYKTWMYLYVNANHYIINIDIAAVNYYCLLL